MRRWLKENQSPDARFSMMVDLYHLPHDFPGYANGMAQADCYQQAELLEAAIGEELGDPRFIPYLQVHEFEALALSDPSHFADWFEGRLRALAALAAECQPYDTPERTRSTQIHWTGDQGDGVETHRPRQRGVACH